MKSNVFVKAIRLKLRFATSRGTLSVEDLFDLPLKDLDEKGQKIREALRSQGGGSLLSDEAEGRKESQATERDRLRFEIIKEVIAIREADVAEKRERTRLQGEEAFLKRLLAARAEEEASSWSREEIEKRLAELRGEDGPSDVEAPANK